MDIYDYSDYKKFVKDWVKQQAKSGRGQWSRFARHLQLSNVQISQIFQGDRNLSNEQSYFLAKLLELTPAETKYFQLMLQYQLASNHNYKSHLAEEMKINKQEAKELINRLPQDDVLDEETKTRFYSDWVYSGIRLLCDIKEINNAEQIANILELEADSVRSKLAFLIEKNLVLRTENGLEVGPKRIHLDKDSPLAKYIHMNWRLKSLQDLSNNQSSDGMRITVPCTSSLSDFEELKQNLRSCLNDFYKKLPESKSESLQCLCIDLFPIYSKPK